jgi:hypothetical protein
MIYPPLISIEKQIVFKLLKKNSTIETHPLINPLEYRAILDKKNEKMNERKKSIHNSKSLFHDDKHT